MCMHSNIIYLLRKAVCKHKDKISWVGSKSIMAYARPGTVKPLSSSRINSAVKKLKDNKNWRYVGHSIKQLKSKQWDHRVRQSTTHRTQCTILTGISDESRCHHIHHIARILRYWITHLPFPIYGAIPHGLEIQHHERWWKWSQRLLSEWYRRLSIRSKRCTLPTFQLKRQGFSSSWYYHNAFFHRQICWGRGLISYYFTICINII